MGRWSKTDAIGPDVKPERNNFNMRQGQYGLDKEQYARAGVGTHLKRAGQSLFGSGRTSENLLNAAGGITKHQLESSPLLSRLGVQGLGGGFMAYSAYKNEDMADRIGYVLPMAAATIAYATGNEIGSAVAKSPGLLLGKAYRNSIGNGISRGIGRVTGIGAGAAVGLAVTAATFAFSNNNFIQTNAAKLRSANYLSKTGSSENTLTHRQKMFNKLSKSGLNDRGALLGNESAILRGVL